MSNFRTILTVFVFITFALTTQVHGAGLPSFEAKLIGAFFKCTDLLLGSELSGDNSEALIPVGVYGSPNDRPLSEYESILGWQFSDLIHQREVDFLDVGGGYGLAVFRKLRNSPSSRGVVINAQDNWRDLLSTEPLPEYLKTDNLIKLLARAGLPIPDRQKWNGAILQDVWMQIKREFGSESDYRNGLAEQFRTNLRQAYEELGTRFDYRVGFAEQVLPTLETQFDVISDVFGAFYYSANRVELLSRYYDALKPGARAFVVIGAQDPRPGGSPFVHSAQTHVFVGGRFATLESFLVEEFPSVFKVDRVDRKWAGDAKTVVLQITKDAAIPSLNLVPRVQRTYVSRTGDHPVFSEWEKRVPKIVVVLEPNED